MLRLPLILATPDAPSTVNVPGEGVVATAPQASTPDVPPVSPVVRPLVAAPPAPLVPHPIVAIPDAPRPQPVNVPGVGVVPEQPPAPAGIVPPGPPRRATPPAPPQFPVAIEPVLPPPHPAMTPAAPRPDPVPLDVKPIAPLVTTLLSPVPVPPGPPAPARDPMAPVPPGPPAPAKPNGASLAAANSGAADVDGLNVDRNDVAPLTQDSSPASASAAKNGALTSPAPATAAPSSQAHLVGYGLLVLLGLTVVWFVTRKH